MNVDKVKLNSKISINNVICNISNIRKIVSIALIILITCVMFILLDYEKVKADNYDQDLFFDNHKSVMLMIDSESGEILDANTAATDFYGYTKEELLEMNIDQINILTPKEIKNEMELAVKEKRNYFLFKHRLKDGSIRGVEVYSSPGNTEDGNVWLFSIVHDITDKIIAQEQAHNRKMNIIYLLIIFSILLLGTIYFINYLKKKEKSSKNKFKSLFDNMNEGFAFHEIILDKENKPIDYVFIDANKAFENMTGLSLEEIKNKRVKEIFPNTEQYWIDTYGDVAINGKSASFTNYSKVLDKYFTVNAYSPLPNHFATMFFDVTQEKKAKEKIEYLSYHDRLTGLYNRHFFEEELKRKDNEDNLPLTLAMLDVNGLKLTNDAFGHEVGDELLKTIARVLTNECKNTDCISRIGGDEFVIIMPNTSHDEAEIIVKNIYKAIERERVRSVIVSVSIGWETKNRIEIDVKKVFGIAEEYMYKKKITESQSMRNQTIKVILHTLNETNEREKIHSERVSKISRKIGVLLNMDEEALKELEITGLMHDIGKIAINNNILNKPSSLSPIEKQDIRKHPEIGYQILKSADVYTRLAEFILLHHERWDGKGYPKGLSGEDIPLISRIICLADSYEAMTANRPYKKTMSHEEAIEELKKCAGTQFDPHLIKILEENNWEIAE